MPTSELHTPRRARLVAALTFLFTACGDSKSDSPPADATSASTASDTCAPLSESGCLAKTGLVGRWQCVTDTLTIGDDGKLTLASGDGQRATGCMTCDGAFAAHSTADSGGDVPVFAVVGGSFGAQGSDAAEAAWSYCNGVDDEGVCARAPEKGDKSARCYLEGDAIDDGDAGSTSPAADPASIAAEPGKAVDLIVTQAWTATGIELASGDQVSIAAAGELDWYTGVCDTCTSTPIGGGCPVDDRNFVVQGVRCWSLVAKVGEQGEPLYVGDRGTFTTSSAGELFLGVNDDNFVDNTGSWSARVDVKPGS